MTTALPNDWAPWRADSPVGGARPTKADLARAARTGLGREDVLPYPTDEQCAGLLRLLIVGINPSLWTAAVNAPFAHPGNRFWKSLQRAGITDATVDTSRGLARSDERMLAGRGIGITNLVSRASARADELTREELRAGGTRLVERVRVLQPKAVAVVGVTAFRVAFRALGVSLGPQAADVLPGWPEAVPLWVLPNPSGLNAHETVQPLAEKWQAVWRATGG